MEAADYVRCQRNHPAGTHVSPIPQNIIISDREPQLQSPKRITYVLDPLAVSLLHAHKPSKTTSFSCRQSIPFTATVQSITMTEAAPLTAVRVSSSPEPLPLFKYEAHAPGIPDEGYLIINLTRVALTATALLTLWLLALSTKHGYLNTLYRIAANRSRRAEYTYYLRGCVQYHMAHARWKFKLITSHTWWYLAYAADYVRVYSWRALYLMEWAGQWAWYLVLYSWFLVLVTLWRIRIVWALDGIDRWGWDIKRKLLIPS